MGRTSYEDADKLLDPLTMYNWDLIIPNVPGVSGHNASDFRTRIQTSVIPGRHKQPITTVVKGVPRQTAGMVEYSQSLPFTALETRDLVALDTFNGWSRYIRNDSNLGAYYSEYTTSVQMLLNDEHDNIIRNITLHKCWLQGWDDVPVDGSANAAVDLSAMLIYQRWSFT